jgi:hypothetical protein
MKNITRLLQLCIVIIVCFFLFKCFRQLNKTHGENSNLTKTEIRTTAKENVSGRVINKKYEERGKPRKVKGKINPDGSITFSNVKIEELKLNKQ